MTDDKLLPFSVPAVSRKKVIAAFDGGRISSDGGVMLLAAAERRLGIAEKLAAVIPDPRDPARTIHPLPDILRARIFAIACGCGAISVGLFAGSGTIGRQPASPFAAMLTMAGPK